MNVYLILIGILMFLWYNSYFQEGLWDENDITDTVMDGAVYAGNVPVAKMNL